MPSRLPPSYPHRRCPSQSTTHQRAVLVLGKHMHIHTAVLCILRLSKHFPDVFAGFREVQEQRKLRFDSDPAFALRVLLERLPSRQHPQKSSTVSEVPLFVVTFDAYEIALRKELVAREFELVRAQTKI